MFKASLCTLLILSTGINTGYAQNLVDEKQKAAYYYSEKTGGFLGVPETRKGVDSLLAISWNNRNTDLHKALRAARKGLNLSESLQYKAGISRAHNLIGISYMRLGVHEQALEHYLTALEMETKQGDKDRIGRVLNSIATLHLHQENYKQAAEYFNKAIHQIGETGNEKRKAIAIMNLGIVYYRQKEYEQSLKHFEQALEINEGLVNNEFIKMVVITNIGNSYVEMGNYAKAEGYLLQAIDYFDREGLVRNQSGAYLYLAKLYRRWENRQQEALYYARKGLEKAESIDNKQYVIDGYELLAGIYEDRSNYEQAYNLYKQFNIVQDSLLNSERAAKINEMQIRFDVEQKNREIELLNKEAALKETQLAKQKLWRNFLIIGLGLVTFIVGLLYRYNSQKKQANLLLEQKNREIEQQNKLLVRLNEEKDEFLGMAAHDLRAPLSGIKSVTSLLTEEKGITEDELQQYIEIIGISADRMVNLINNLLDVNTIENGANRLEIAPVDIREPIQQVINDFEKVAEKKEISIVTQITPDSKPVMIDDKAMQRILDNLVSNAIKFSPTGSRVEVATRIREDLMELSVKDNGPGIPLVEQDRLFQRFSRLSTKPTGNEGSTGLGLFIVKKLVEAMGGSVWCESQPGEGTEFIIILPLALAPSD